MSAIILEVNSCFKSVAKTEVHQILGSKPERMRPLGSFRLRRYNGSRPDLKDVRVNRFEGCGLNVSDSNHGKLAVSCKDSNGLEVTIIGGEFVL